MRRSMRLAVIDGKVVERPTPPPPDPTAISRVWLLSEQAYIMIRNACDQIDSDSLGPRERQMVDRGWQWCVKYEQLMADQNVDTEPTDWKLLHDLVVSLLHAHRAALARMVVEIDTMVPGGHLSV